MVEAEASTSHQRRPTFGVAFGLAALVLLAVAVALAPGQARAADWSQFHGSNDRAGYNLYESAIGRGNVAAIKTFWRRSLVGTVGDPVIANGVLYVGSSAGVLAAFDASSGVPLWSVPTGAAVSTPGVANGIVYAGMGDGTVGAFDARTGVKLWSATTGRFILSSPAIADGVVYIGSVDARLYAFDARTGATLWTYTTGAAVISSPAVVNGVVYVGSNDKRLYALDAQTGSRRWTAAGLGPDRVDACGRERGRVRRLEQRAVRVRCPDGSEAVEQRPTPSRTPLSGGRVRDGLRRLGDRRPAGVPRGEPARCAGPPRHEARSRRPRSRTVSCTPARADGFLYAFDAGTGQGLWSFDFESSGRLAGDRERDRVRRVAEARVHAFGGNVDSDGDSIEDSHDNCRLLVNPDQDDSDGDRVGNACDNAPYHYNPYQQDADRDGLPDVLDPDDDNDDVVDDKDNCPFHPNPRQEDSNGDGIGDACPESLGLDRDLHFAFVQRDKHFERFQIGVLAGAGLGPPGGSLKAQILVEGDLPLELRLYDPRGELVASGTSGEPLHVRGGLRRRRLRPRLPARSRALARVRPGAHVLVHRPPRDPRPRA